MIYAFGECELDTRRGELRRAGEPRHLEPQAYDVLSYLLLNRERLVPKEELLDRVWGGRFVTPATLNSRLKAVRQAVGDDGQTQRVIRTIRGRGFRFVAAVTAREQTPARRADAVITSDIVDRPDREAGLPGERLRVASDLVARTSELRRLGELLEAVNEGARQIALVTGEPGIGKSALIAAFLAHLPEGTHVARGQCVDQRGPGEPYLPILDALGRLCRGAGGAELLEHLVACAPTWLVQMPSLLTTERMEAAQLRSFGATHTRMLREMVEAIEVLTRTTPLVLVLEDIHWSDPSTLDLIAWLGERPEPARLLIVATYRPSDASPDLHRAIGSLRRGGRATEIALRPWHEAELRDFLAQRLRGRLPADEIVSLLHARTDGNPLFVQHLLHAWLEDSALVEQDGGWAAAVPVAELSSGVPESLRLLVEQRVERLSDDEQQMLEVGSVAGPDFTAAVVAAAMDANEEMVEAACHALARRGGMLRAGGTVVWPDGSATALFRFTHYLVREVLYERLPQARRRRLHERIGTRLEAAYGRLAAEHATELALHFRLGRDDARAIQYLRLSARQAARRSAHREAIAHLTSAIELTPRVSDRSEALRIELELQRMLGSALLHTRGWGDADAERAYARARAIAEQVDDPTQLARVLHGMAYVHEVRGDFHRSEPLLEACLKLGDRAPGPYTSIESRELLSCSLFHQGKFENALRNARVAIEGAEPHTPGDAFVASLGMNAALATHVWAGLSLWCLGFPDQALEPLRTAIGIARSSELIYMQAASHGAMAMLRQFRRELAPLIEHSEVAADISERQGYPFHHAIALTLRGWARVVEGGVDDGLNQIRRGLAMHEAAGAGIERPYSLGVLADALLRAGRVREGLDVIDEALSTIERHARSFYWEAELHRLRGELRFLEGAADAAEASLREALAVASRQGARSLELRAAMSLCRLGDRRRGGRGDSRERLVAIYGCFTEGLDTPDLREAAAMLKTGA